MAFLLLAPLARASGLGRRKRAITAQLHHCGKRNSLLLHAPNGASVLPAALLAACPNGILHQRLIGIWLDLVVGWNCLHNLVAVLNRLATVVDEVNIKALQRYATDKGMNVRCDMMAQARTSPL